MNWVNWLALVAGIGLASARLTRLAVTDTIFDHPREVIAGLHPWLEKLIECPWCASAYTTLVVLVGVNAVTSVALPALAFFAAWQVAMVAFWLTELAFDIYHSR